MITHLRFSTTMALLGIARGSEFSVMRGADGVSYASSTPPAPTYRAVLTSINGAMVFGTAVVFVGQDGVVGYGGFLESLEPDLTTEICAGSPANGCGVHIHAGFGCSTPEEQLGHYWDSTTVPEDPWLVERYASDSNGMANFQGVINIGTDDVEGRAFIAHAFDGSRVACGVLERVDNSELLTTTTTPLATASVPDVFSVATVLPLEDPSDVCVFGRAMNLQPNLVSFQIQADSEDCVSANGCGVHIHSGVDCSDAMLQGGHFYVPDVVGADPWLLAGYRMTDADGSAYYMDCVSTGADGYEGRALIVHANDGSRISCSVLQQPEESSSLFSQIIAFIFGLLAIAVPGIILMGLSLL